jgi:regulator of protease activity HflC (stomatin/prohibitin superfamily)
MIDKKKRNYFIKLGLSIALITIIFFPFVVVEAGQRGVLMKFGEVQDQILGEGLHLIIPTVTKDCDEWKTEI